MAFEGFGLVYSSEGIPTAKEPWALGKDVANKESWLEEIIEERERRARQSAYQEYVRKLAELNEKRVAELEAAREDARRVREHARKIGEITLQLQQEAEEREQERAKVERDGAELEQKFRRLADQWREETMVSSSSDDRLSHEAYLKIIGIGPSAIPLILRELEQQGGHWFVALRMITEANPVEPNEMGNVKKMKEAWLRWGRQNRYL